LLSDFIFAKKVTIKMLKYIFSQISSIKSKTFNNYIFRSLPKTSPFETDGTHQNPHYTGQHHFHPIHHDHESCERIVINASSKTP